MGEIAEQIRVMMKAAIESVPRTIVPEQRTPDKPKDTTPSQKVERIEETNEKNSKKDNKEIKQPKAVSKELSDMQPENRAIYRFQGVDIEVYKYFESSPSVASKEEVERLKYIQDWAGEDLAKGMKKIEDIEIKLGRRNEEDRLIGVYNYIRIRNLR